MTHYYDYYNHKFNSPDKENPFKEPPTKFEPSKAGTQNQKPLLSVPDIFSDNICYAKAKSVAVEIIYICKELMQKKDYTILAPICNQIVRSSTSTKANIAEANSVYCSSRDKTNKFNIAYKECMETISWISLLYEIEELTDEQYTRLTNECMQIVKILSKSIHSLRKKCKTK